jgi:hypothetical protein
MKNYIKEILVDKVIHQMKQDISQGDTTAIEELLEVVSAKFLVDYLPETKDHITKEMVDTFIETYGTKDDSYIMMVDHICIKWGQLKYYIPKACSVDAKNSEIYLYLETYKSIS